MNKKANTLLFILGATVFNIIITVAFIFLLGFIFFTFIFGYFSAEEAQANAFAWGLVIIFILSIVSSFFLYRYLLGLLLKKINIEKYFDPIIRSKYKPLR